ncbi:hypothetical protein Gasu2_40290 [Galdieria sulphuraria]|uniref:WHIM1 domain-containing protein n=1 Tax=Galdieria sulphuraria TaxID=130081 RepID=M2XVZ4_GALSU|nr:uncharacterized protein Gasu_48970 [Galdieria sulphuraria]EME27604.1 hypothetical protein Gasu_48970 [Galdieria sulphuraria]GJD09798.1 hypothetical protein Gasu2_40290 [Galdieria sulphuraria]|eukprot:XP_005704124.1 hypothetical protein Gasu_48970 [Galdieria sulphuraria]
MYTEEYTIKRSWEFASIVQFLFAFGKIIHLDQYLVIERLHPLLILDSLINPLEPYNFRLISIIHVCLLNQLGRKTSTASTGPRSWLSNIRNELKKQREYYQVVHLLHTCQGEEEISLYDSRGVSLLQTTDYISLRPTQRLILLKYLCERVAETCESIRNYIQGYIEQPSGVKRKRCKAIPPRNPMEINNIRCRGLGKDAKGNEFTYIGNQEPNSNSFWIYTEEASHNNSRSASVLSTVEELSECIGRIENSEAPRDRVLAQKLREILSLISSREDSLPTMDICCSNEESTRRPLEERKMDNKIGSDSENLLHSHYTGEGEEVDKENCFTRKCRKRVIAYNDSDNSDVDSVSSGDSSFEISSDIELLESDEDSNTSFSNRTQQKSMHSVYYPLLTFSSTV